MGIELRSVSKQVGADTHIYDTDLALEEGGFNVLLGTTLAGKTSLMRLMAGLDKPSRGEVWFAGQNVTHLPVQKRNVAMVYQAFINYPNMSVYDNIASPLRVARIPDREIHKRVGDMAELLRLTAMLDRMPSELSGGQQQRTALARALVKNAQLVLLDEPLANLDYKLREELRDELPKLFTNTGATVVYATSEPIEALMLGGRTAAVHEGRVTQYGPTASIYHDPNTLISARVFSDPPINTATVVKSGSELRMTDQVFWPAPEFLAPLPDGSYTIAVRAHHLTPVALGRQGVLVEGTVRIAEISGSESVIRVDVEGNNWISESHGVHPYGLGDVASMRLDVSRCFYFTADGTRIRAQAEAHR